MCFACRRKVYPIFSALLGSSANLQMARCFQLLVSVRSPIRLLSLLLTMANMQCWRVVVVCFLVALIATASAQFEEQCKQDGDQVGAKLAFELCLNLKVGRLL